MFYQFLREFLCKSYDPLQAPSNSMPKRSPTPIRHRPNHCPQCQARLTAHRFYSRTLVDAKFDGTIRVRRYLCRSCKRTVSLLPDFADGLQRQNAIGPSPCRGRATERMWIEQNRAAFAGQWVAVEGDRLVAAGTDAQKVFSRRVRRH
jgi:hypothetical protein